MAFRPPSAHASTPFPVALRKAAPYSPVLSFALPGTDEFPEEKQAMEWEAELRNRLINGSLAVIPENVTYRLVEDDVSVAEFGTGGKPWLSTLGEILDAKFYVLAGGKLRYEIKSRAGEQLQYRVGNARGERAAGRLTLVDETVASGLWFRDISSSAFGQNSSYVEQLCRGIPYWRARLDPATGIDIYGSNGISVADLNGDGLDEIYVCQPGGLPNRLYQNVGGGKFKDVSSGSGLDILDDTSCALFLDWSNRGVQDAIILRGSGPLYFRNNGKNHFELQPDSFRFAEPPKGSFTGMAAADFDLDGRLDLYLCTYSFFQSEAQYRYPAPYHDAQNGPPNFLLSNRLDANGGGYFEDVTAASGISANNTRFSFAPAWCDTTGDGWPDLYVANDFGRNNFYRNRKGQFSDEAANAGIEDLGPGMSASWFDYDGDGRPDLYVSNMWSSSGARVVAHPKFKPSKQFPEAYRRHTKGNSLYRNLGNGNFSDEGEAQCVEVGRWAWASGGFDFDGDGRPEIFSTCGMLTNRSNDDLMSFFWRQVVAKSPDEQRPQPAYENGWNAINQLIREDYGWNGNEPGVFYCRRGTRYFDASGVSGLDMAEDGRAFAVTDIDGDGVPDLILKNRLGPQLRAFENLKGRESNWVSVELVGTKCNRDAIGARVDADGKVQFLQAGSGYLSQHSKRLHFGIGSEKKIRRLRVDWPSGHKQYFADVDAGFRYRITEGTEKVEKFPFLARVEYPPPEELAVDNTPRLQSTWFYEPIPLPEPFPGPGLMTLDANSLSKQGDRAAWYALFRRYLFDYRTDLTLPFSMLIDGENRACKIYAEVPTKQQVARDLALLAGAKREALPFAGRYVTEPHRDTFKLGAAFYWAGYPDQALPYLAESLKRNQFNERVLLAMGKIHLESGRLVDAESYLRRAAAADPANAEIWNELGGVAAARENHAEALQQYIKALTLDPNSLYPLLNAAQTSAKLNRSTEAESFYRRALRVSPQSNAAHIGLGLLLAASGKEGEAKALFLRAVELDPKDPSAVNNLGVLYMKMGQTGDAISALRFGVGQLPDNELLALNLARAYVATGDRDRARAVMQRLLDIVPTSEAAKQGLRDLERQ